MLSPIDPWFSFFGCSLLLLIPDSSQSSANLATVLFEESLSCGDLSLPSALKKVHDTMRRAIRDHSMIFQWVRRSRFHLIICSRIDSLQYRDQRRILMGSAMICRIFLLILNPFDLVFLVFLVWKRFQNVFCWTHFVQSSPHFSCDVEVKFVNFRVEVSWQQSLTSYRNVGLMKWFGVFHKQWESINYKISFFFPSIESSWIVSCSANFWTQWQDRVHSLRSSFASD